MKEALHVISLVGYKGDVSPKTPFFNVAELHEKLKVNFADILLATADEDGSRNKLIWLKEEAKAYTLMNISFPKLLNCSDKLIMVNKFTIVSIEAVRSYRHDIITLKNIFPGWNNKQITLGRNYRKGFYGRIEIQVH